MNFQQVIETEKKMRNDGIDGAFTIDIPALVSVKGEPDLMMQVLRVTPSHRNMNYFYTEKYPKTQIMIHFTEGHLRGDLSQLTKENQHVSVPFVIARDGGIYRLFGSEAWAFHVGKNPVGSTNEILSRSSIGIELSNYGPLTLQGNDLLTPYGDVYCSVNDTSEYIKLPKPYRGKSYFASFTEEQYDALIVLLRYLTALFNIPRAFLPENVRYEATTQAVGFKGIVSHVNVRADKIDIGPAFDWAKVVAGVTAASYTSIAPATRGFVAPLDSDSELDMDVDLSGVTRDFSIGDEEPDC
ncbi:MAG: N-acetylmuramoyl-L-alanine amidase [Saprospiraceae bacterium]|nr:N-acetylmuramoyl-L-alanine amidase [Saprospiraceae bacterium]